MGGVAETVYEAAKRLAYRILPAALMARLQRLHYFRTLQSFDPEDEPDLPIALQIIGSGDTVVDVGANLGIYTVFMARRVTDRGRVISIEPIPDTFDILARIVRRFGLDQVELINAAASSSAGVTLMEVPRSDFGMHMHYLARIVRDAEAEDKQASRRRVRLCRLDDVLETCANVTFIKCDVEGHELECIRGAAQVIRQHSPAWLIEVSGNPDETGTRAHALFETLSRAGYRAWVRGPHGLRPRDPGTRSVNYFFLTEAHMTRLRASVRMP